MNIVARIVMRLRWREVLAVAKLAAQEVDREDLYGVRLEVLEGKGDEEWPVVLTAADGRRLAALESSIQVEGSWGADMPRALTIPLGLIKRVKKPGKSVGGAWAEVAFDCVEVENEVRPMTVENAEGRRMEVTRRGSHIEVRNLMVSGFWDGLRIQQDVVPQNFPDWRRLVPTVPHVPVRDVKIRGGQLAGFSEALELLDGKTAVALFRSSAAAPDEQSVLVVRGELENFFGLLMPVRAEISSLTELPLWLDDGLGSTGPQDEEVFFRAAVDGTETDEDAAGGEVEGAE